MHLKKFYKTYLYLVNNLCIRSKISGVTFEAYDECLCEIIKTPNQLEIDHL